MPENNIIYPGSSRVPNSIYTTTTSERKAQSRRRAALRVSGVFCPAAPPFLFGAQESSRCYSKIDLYHAALIRRRRCRLYSPEHRSTTRPPADTGRGLCLGVLRPFGYSFVALLKCLPSTVGD
ncbi:hypothetical protein BRADI_1g40262v3 [Brachypodium distachyon]|uniref:Uncharacterized protein n=1 Tax=Brachypodium distachyon TaxID=15368 RepID=A0A2K2DNL7_BRADI|nr:hypothetical protein BRADI_1g40262v3 [Brachypodium distachyon]